MECVRPDDMHGPHYETEAPNTEFEEDVIAENAAMRAQILTGESCSRIVNSRTRRMVFEE